ncbi:hypothetical protein JMJ77_0007612 [Colletotrichum scovillei]|uniref:Uncharacterized protein n=1 Tax=Colletotrichum scovillei TaxID=1209932 RepID=A0A9P7RD62_9PEZI|nr:hypothetical protein JMJ77_0007612 [Colletotrichum scovillei]KAG7074625.1 hypothetical protein JMJ76_0011100 [Colletotrichum scovillei]KAG7081685.1 hypothetical protein JMJ78_0003801 [Colletotrichum scovillei]
MPRHFLGKMCQQILTGGLSDKMKRQLSHGIWKLRTALYPA